MNKGIGLMMLVSIISVISVIVTSVFVLLNALGIIAWPAIISVSPGLIAFGACVLIILIYIACNGGRYG